MIKNGYFITWLNCSVSDVKSENGKQYENVHGSYSIQLGKI